MTHLQFALNKRFIGDRPSIRPHAHVRIYVRACLLFSLILTGLVWSLLTAYPASAKAGTDTLGPDEWLYADQRITSADGRFTLIMQSDGNLVLYRNGVGALWATGTVGSGGDRLVMQSDGNLVVYTPNAGPVWASNTVGARSNLRLQNDGNLVVVRESGEPVWSTNTIVGEGIPEAVVAEETEGITELDAGNGYLYWSNPCPRPLYAAQADESADPTGQVEPQSGAAPLQVSPTTTYLRRKPINGSGTRTLSQIPYLGYTCTVYLQLTPTPGGLILLDRAPYTGVSFRPDNSPDDPPKPVVASGGGYDLEFAGGYVYGKEDRNVVRYRPDGSGYATVFAADFSSYDYDFGVAGNNVYVVDPVGLWVASTTCGSLPCPKTLLLNAPTSNYSAWDVAAGVVNEATGEVAIISSHGARWFDNVPAAVRRFTCKGTACSVATVYTAPTVNWFVGAPVVGKNDFFWVAYCSSCEPEASYRLYRMPYSGGQPRVLVNSPTFLNPAIDVDNDFVYYTDGVRIYRVRIGATLFLPLMRMG